MHYYILLTELCNSKCRYCYEKSLKEFDNELNKKFNFDFSAPTSSEVDLKKLKEFLDKDKSAVLIFYGGEPLLEIEKIKAIIDNINIPFRMQTNGKLLDKLPADYLNKISKILISLDGNKERTDLNRGEGTYGLVMNNLKLIKKNRYRGELIARMCISDFPDVYGQVKCLIEAGFTSVHWQIDAGFYKFDFKKSEFENFVLEYNKSISKLINFWAGDMQKNKRVLKLYPFLAITESLLKKEKTKLRCGAGYQGYAITTNGKIVACPIMNSIKNFGAGSLDSNPEKLKKFDIKNKKCLECFEKDLCGGRCLYWHEANLWPEEGNELICKTIKHLIKEIEKQIPEIQNLIKHGKIKLADFEYEKYFGPEIIP